jgi:hypothetical protein
MVTRRRTRAASTRRRTTTRRTSSRTRSRTTSRTTRRRRPRLATTLGSAAALGLIAVYTRFDWWPWRITVTAGLLCLLIVYFLWSRRGDIYDEIKARHEIEAQESEAPREEETGG